MLNVMLDLETLGTSSNSCIVTIAAVKFEFGSDKVEPFSINIDPKSSKQFGMVVEKETLEWWKTQPKEAVAAWMKDPQPLEYALDKFIEFIGPDWKNVVYWCNGMNVDIPWLEWSLRATGKQTPWKYWNLRDARTVYAVCGINMKKYERVGVYHNAVDDCLTQIKALKECMVGAVDTQH